MLGNVRLKQAFDHTKPATRLGNKGALRKEPEFECHIFVFGHHAITCNTMNTCNYDSKVYKEFSVFVSHSFLLSKRINCHETIRRRGSRLNAMIR